MFKISVFNNINDNLIVDTFKKSELHVTTLPGIQCPMFLYVYYVVHSCAGCEKLGYCSALASQCTVVEESD